MYLYYKMNAFLSISYCNNNPFSPILPKFPLCFWYKCSKKRDLISEISFGFLLFSLNLFNKSLNHFKSRPQCRRTYFVITTFHKLSAFRKRISL